MTNNKEFPKAVLRASGCIGYYQCDLSLDGDVCLSKFTTITESLKTDEFVENFEGLIENLRTNGLLQSRQYIIDELEKSDNPIEHSRNAIMRRVESEDFCYLIDANPEGNFNIVISCYQTNLYNRYFDEMSKGIRFIDSHYHELFRINNGDTIVIELADGDKIERKCYYIDNYHTLFGGDIYHICEFAECAEKNHWKVYPKEN